jgi:hypothetical protein
MALLDRLKDAARPGKGTSLVLQSPLLGQGTVLCLDMKLEAGPGGSLTKFNVETDNGAA